MSKVFDSYAKYYDLLYCDKDYVAEAEYVAKFVRQHALNAQRVLELGCGTGAHAEHLARMGYSVHGVDLSAEMLLRAENRKAALPLDVAQRLSFGHGDVRTVQIGKSFDVVISLFHVMSYQKTNDDLVSALETASSHLSPGGIFLFDFWYGPAVLTQRPETRVRRLSGDDVDVTRIAEPTVWANENLVDVNYTIFVKDRARDQIQEFRETHCMRYLFLPELFQLLPGVGFKLVGAFSWMSDQAPADNTWAGFVIAQK